MILLSDIIKAEYVIYDNSAQSNIDMKQSAVHEAETLCSFREDLYEIYDQRETILREAEEEALRIISKIGRAHV